MVLLTILQLAVPTLLLAWLVFGAIRAQWAFLIQAALTGLLLADLLVIGMWMLPVWWAPWVFIVIYFIIIAVKVLKSQSRTELSRRYTLAVLGFLFVVSGYPTYIAVLSLKGRSYDRESVVDIASPLTTGTYIVAQGGSNRTVNGHFETLDPNIPRYADWVAQSRGVDLVRINATGLRTDGLLPTDPARYASFGTPVVAPCNGIVVVAQDGLRDMPVPQMDLDNKLGNHVITDCGAFNVFIAHLREGSVKVATGQAIRTGDPIGDIGNSGRSAEPHLHIHIQQGLPPMHLSPVKLSPSP